MSLKAIKRDRADRALSEENDDGNSFTKTSRLAYKILKQIISYDTLEVLRTKYSPYPFHLQENDIIASPIVESTQWYYDIDLQNPTTMNLIILKEKKCSDSLLARKPKRSRNDGNTPFWALQFYKNHQKDHSDKMLGYGENKNEESKYFDDQTEPLIGIDTIWKKAGYNYYSRWKDIASDINMMFIKYIWKRAENNEVDY